MVMRGLSIAVACALSLLGCNDGRPPLVGGGPEGRCPPGKAATFDKLGGRTYVCQDEQLVLFVTCIERVAALTNVSTDTYGGLTGAPGSAASTASLVEALQRSRSDATAICARFTENRTGSPPAETPARAQAAFPQRYEPPPPMSDANPYGGMSESNPYGETQRQ